MKSAGKYLQGQVQITLMFEARCQCPTRHGSRWRQHPGPILEVWESAGNASACELEANFAQAIEWLILGYEGQEPAGDGLECLM
jgi:hypothetical protein